MYGNETIFHGDYNLFSSRNFFGLSDPVRLIKLIYILISAILNVFIIISIIYSKNKKTGIALEITCNILVVNFLHAFSYIFQWIIKDPNIVQIIKDKEGKEYEVGGLLVGNPENPNPCYTQAFFLIFTSLGQEFLINFFFYMTNKNSLPEPKKIRIFMIIIAYFFPGLFSLIYLFVEELGMNDRFCYVKKFIATQNKNGLYRYEFNSKSKYYIAIIYIIRTLNLIFSIYLFANIITYVKKNTLGKKYIFKSSYLLMIQMITVTLGLIYRIGAYFSDEFGRNFADIYLCLNTLDSVLFPLFLVLSNSIIKNLYYSVVKKEYELEVEDDDDDNNIKRLDESTHKLGEKNDKTFAMIEIKDNNNNFDFSLSN